MLSEVNVIFSILPIPKDLQIFIIGFLLGLITNKYFYKGLLCIYHQLKSVKKHRIRDLQAENEKLHKELDNIALKLTQKENEARYLQKRLYAKNANENHSRTTPWNI